MSEQDAGEACIPESVLEQHWLEGIECDHERKLDNPRCACMGEHLGWHPTVGAAVKAWIAHSRRVARLAPAQRTAGGPASVFLDPAMMTVGMPYALQVGSLALAATKRADGAVDFYEITKQDTAGALPAAVVALLNELHGWISGCGHDLRLDGFDKLADQATRFCARIDAALAGLPAAEGQ